MNEVKREKKVEKNIRLDAQILVKKGARAVVWCGVGALSVYCRLPFGALPLVFALVCAADMRVLAIALGAMLAALGEETPWLLCGVLGTTVLLRVLIRLTLDSPFRRGERHSASEIIQQLFKERLKLRILLCAVSAFAFSLCTVAAGGFLYYDLVGLILCVLIAPALAFLAVGFFEKSGIWREVGFLVLVAGCMFGASQIVIYGVSAALAAGIFLVLAVTERKGILSGLLTAAAAGIAGAPKLLPVFAVAAVAMLVFLRISRSLAATSTLALGVVWSFYIEGIYALSGTLGGLLVGCLGYSAFCRLAAAPSSLKAESKVRVLEADELEEVRLLELKRRISALGGGLRRISEVFAKAERLSEDELCTLIDSAFAFSCDGCSEAAECRASGACSTAKQKAAEALLCGDGSLPYTQVRSVLPSCTRLSDILDEIGYNASPSLSGSDEPYLCCSDFADLLEEREAWGALYIDRELSEHLCTALSEVSPYVSGAAVYGKERRNIYIKLRAGEDEQRARESVCAIVKRAMPFEVECEDSDVGEVGDASGVSGGRCIYAGAVYMHQRPNLSVQCVYKRRRARKESRFCGDSISVFKNSDARFFAIVSDGMGCGKEAEAVSRICTEFLSNMLSVGGMSHKLCTALNTLLCRRREHKDRVQSECSSTLDLFEIDLISGDSGFFKSGSAPSYILHDGNLLKLRSHSMPLGILADTQAKESRFLLSAGDVIVMMSDGVCGEGEDCPWLYELLRRNAATQSLERIAELIVKYAVGNGSDDDISVVVLKVSESKYKR